MRRIASLFICMLLILALPAQAATLSLTDYSNGHVNFDVVNKAIEITLNTGSDGTLYIYFGERSALSDSTQNLLYAANISKSDADIVKTISLPGIGTKYGEYIVEFYGDYPGTEYASDGFTYLSPKAALVIALTSLENPNGGAIETIIKSDADNFALVSAEADMTYYNKVNKKSAVYAKMVSGLSLISEFGDIIELFTKSALAQYNEEIKSSQENQPNTVQKPTTTVMVTGGGGSSSTPTTPPTVTVPEETKPQKSFADMAGHWAGDYVNRLSSLGIMNGYEDDTFRGDNPITRAELAKTLVEAFDIPLGGSSALYNDVDSGAWYYKYILAANAGGLVSGFDDGSFKPDQNIIRQDAALMIYRALALKISMSAAGLAFADSSNISAYASEAVSALANLKIITGDETNRFNPSNELSRAELAALICRSLDCISSK